MSDPFAKERKEAERMAPAHAFMQVNARAKIKAKAAALMDKTSHATTNEQLKRLAKTGQPLILDFGDKRECKLATFGLSLHGVPELYCAWPCPSMRNAAAGVLQDLILTALNGEAKDKFAVGRMVYAQRFGVAYGIVPAGPVDDSPLFSFLETHGSAKPVFALELHFGFDLRDGVDLPLGVKNGRAIWKPKDGVDTFTGLVRVPIPSPAWAEAGFNHCVVKLLHEDSFDIEGPCRVLPPEEAMKD